MTTPGTAPSPAGGVEPVAVVAPGEDQHPRDRRRTMAKAKATAVRMCGLYEGVGFDADTHNPAVAVAVHPTRGIAIVGPFLTPEAAGRWIQQEGDCHLAHSYGSVAGVRWHTEFLDVPRSYQ